MVGWGYNRFGGVGGGGRSRSLRRAVAPTPWCGLGVCSTLALCPRQVRTQGKWVQCTGHTWASCSAALSPDVWQTGRTGWLLGSQEWSPAPHFFHRAICSGERNWHE